MTMSYNPINWQNEKIGGTKVNATNLNIMDKGIADAHDMLADHDKKINDFANKQIPEEYVKESVDNYIAENQAGLASKEEVSAVAENVNQLSSEIAYTKKEMGIGGNPYEWEQGSIDNYGNDYPNTITDIYNPANYIRTSFIDTKKIIIVVPNNVTCFMFKYSANHTFAEMVTLQKGVNTITDIESIRLVVRYDDTTSIDVSIGYSMDIVINTFKEDIETLKETTIKKGDDLFYTSYPDLELEWELGALNVNDGGNVGMTTRIRNTTPFFIPKGSKIGLLDYSNHSYTACLYDENGTFLESISTEWVTDDTIIEKDCYVRFSMKYNDNREINSTVSALNGGIYGLGNLLKVLRPTYFQNFVDSRWSGKNIIVYGDSISDEDKFGIKKYCSFVANWLDCNIKNTAIGGAGFYNWAYAETDSLLAQSQIDYGNNYDLVIIFAGTNDYGNNGGVEETLFTNTVKTVIDNLRTKYPLAKFLIATPLRRSGGNIANSKGMTLNDYCDIIRSVSKEKGIALLDLYNIGNFNADNETFVNTFTYNKDGLHPTEVWHKNTLAFQFLNVIRGL